MTFRKPARKRAIVRLSATIAAAAIAWLLWLHGLLHSPVLDRDLLDERRNAMRSIREAAPDYRQEKDLAEAYWRRYPDLKTDGYFGSDGPLGIFGAREHYRQHGRHEGRVFAPIVAAEDPDREKVLAEAYWQRYPDVEKSVVWGRNGSLGILGPRDHYLHYGRKQGRYWGPPGEKPKR